MDNKQAQRLFPLPEGFEKNSHGGFLHKPMNHWRREARKLVMQGLVRASMVDTRSIIGAMASRRLMEIAKAEDPEMLEEVIKDLEDYQRGFAQAMGSFVLTPAERRNMKRRKRG